MRFFKKKYLSIVIFLIIFVNVSLTIFSVRSQYLSTNFWNRYPDLKKSYEESQYVKKTQYWIPDNPVNSYAGASYIKGVNPTLIAPDTPPLGRYFIGFSTVLFNNENIIILVFGVGSLILLYFLGMMLYKDRFYALLPVLFLTFEPLFKRQLTEIPLLDIIQLFFLLLSFYLFIKGIFSKKYLYWFIGTNLALGAFISVKFFATGITVVLAYFLTVVLNKDRKRIISYVLTIPASILILLGSYSRLLFLGYSFRDLIGVQKWVYLYHKSQLIYPFSIWPFLLFNKWHVWWGDHSVISDSQWSITWPIITLSSIFIIVLYLLKKIERNKVLEVFLIWAVLYICFFSFGQITPRYLVIYIPILYLIFFYGVKQFFNSRLLRNKIKI